MRSQIELIDCDGYCFTVIEYTTTISVNLYLINI